MDLTSSFLHFKVPKALFFFSDIERPNHLGFSLETVSGQVDLDAGPPGTILGRKKVILGRDENGIGFRSGTTVPP